MSPRLLTAGLVALALVLLGAAPAGAKPIHKPAPAATPAQAKQIAKLEALTGTLTRELAVLEARSAALVTKAATAAPAPPPSALPFQGPAGGSLTGAYPGPRLAPSSVGTAELIPHSVDSAAVRVRSLTGADVQDGSITPGLINTNEVSRANIAPRSGGALVMGTAVEYPLPGDHTGERPIFRGEQSVITRLSCPAGTTLLTGGWEWADENGNGTIMFESHPAEEGDPNTTWEWRAKVRSSDGTDNVFKPKLLCLFK